jgi:hypothetical protein
LKISDYGIKEELKRGKRELRSVAMRDTLDAKDAIVKLVNNDRMTDEDVIALLKKPDIIDHNLMVGLARRYGWVYFDEYLTATTKEEKAYVVLRMLKDRSLAPTIILNPNEPKKSKYQLQELKIYDELKKEGF